MNTPQAYQIPDEFSKPMEIPQGQNLNGLPNIKPEDMQFFGELMQAVDESEMRPEEIKKRKIKELLLKIKRGTP